MLRWNQEEELLDKIKKTNHLVFDVHVVIQVSQASLLKSWGDFLDVTAHVLEQLCVAITVPETHFGFTCQMDRVEDVLIPEWGKKPVGIQFDFYIILSLLVAFWKKFTTLLVVETCGATYSGFLTPALLGHTLVSCLSKNKVHSPVLYPQLQFTLSNPLRMKTFHQFVQFSWVVTYEPA